jgi:uncharacterized oligopeptide transporter (OPT) family protein
MKKRIVRVAPFQVGKVAAVLYGLLSIPLVLIMAAATALAPASNPMGWVMIIVLPVFYVVFGFIFTAIAAWVYNLVAGWTGGIEFETEEIST